MRMPLLVEPSLPWMLITILVLLCDRSGHPAGPGVGMYGVGAGVGRMNEVERVRAVKDVVSSSITDLPLSPACGESRARSDQTKLYDSEFCILNRVRMKCGPKGCDLEWGTSGKRKRKRVKYVVCSI